MTQEMFFVIKTWSRAPQGDYIMVSRSSEEQSVFCTTEKGRVKAALDSGYRVFSIPDWKEVVSAEVLLEVKQ